MQQQVPIRNYVMFFASVFALTFGWSYLKPKLFPPPPKPETLWPFEKFPRADQAALVARLAVATADPLQLTGQYLLGPVPATSPRPQWPHQASPRKDQDAALARMVLGAATGDAAAAARVASALPLNEQNLRRHAEASQPGQEITLGGPDHHITATLTSRGAGVRELILNEFPAADRFGLPVVRDGKPVPVALLPRVDDAPPAYAIFHYARPEDNESRPLDTLGRINWKVEKNDAPREVVFSADVPDQGVRLTKTFSLRPGDYHVGLTVRVDRVGAGAGQKFRYQLAGGRELPIEGVWYATTFRQALVGLVANGGSFYRLTADNSTMSRPGGTDRFRRDDKKLVYAALAVQFFASAIVADNLDAAGNAIPDAKRRFIEFARATVEDSPDPKKPFLDDITVRAISEPVDPTPDAAVEHRYLLYHGPVKVRQLLRLRGDRAVDPDLVERYSDTLHLRTLTDYGNFGIWTDLIIFFTNVIHRLVWILTAVFPAGIAIILVTVIVRGLMFPISKRQAASMQRMQDKMQKLAPELKQIEAKFKDDFMMKQQAQRELYRKHNVNPAAGLGGCLMLFLQMPIFMGLYYALQESVFFRLDRFLWIRNLAAPDMLFWWGEKVPFLTQPDALGTFFYLGPFFNLLPIVGAGLIFVQQRLSMPKEMTDEQRQQAAIMKYMTGFMALMFYRVPAGLSLYFICSSLWGLGERKVVKMMIEHESAQAAKQKAKPVAREPGRFAQWWEKVLREASKK